MSVQEQKTQEQTAEVAEAPPAKPVGIHALLFEIESVAVNSRKIAYGLLKKALAEHDVALTPPLFSMHCLAPLPDFYVPGLLAALAAKGVSAEKLLAEINLQLANFYASDKAALDPELETVVKEAVKRNISVGVLSAMPREAAEALMDRLGLTERGAQLFTFEDVEPAFPRADTWLKIAKAIARLPRNCVVVAGTARSCRAALAAGMHCVVVPDEFTAFQDFSGADLVLGSLADLSPGKMFETVFARPKL